MRIGRFEVNPIDAILAVLLPVTAIGLYIEFSDRVTNLDIINAARNGDARLVYERVDTEFDFLARDDQGRTLLHAAVESGDEDIVRYILQSGGAISIDAFDLYGYTPVHLSLGAQTPLGRVDSLSIYTFLEYGIDPNLKTRFGEPLLVSAIEVYREQCAISLLEAGADPNVGFVGGRPLLSDVASKSMSELLQVLLEKGVPVEVHATDIAPLAYAIQRSYVDAVRLLLKHGADPNAQWRAQWSAYFGPRRTIGPRMYKRSRNPNHEVSLRLLDLALWYNEDCALALAEHGAKSTWFASFLIFALQQ
jgi:ankyrin repeat protein